MTHPQKEAFTAERAKSAENFNGFINNCADSLRFSQLLSSANSAFSAVNSFCSGLMHERADLIPGFEN
jgi:hypothetical protein